MTAVQVRENLGLTQSELAHMLGVHPMTVSKWERGQGNPNSADGLPATVSRVWPALEAWDGPNGRPLKRVLRRQGALVALSTVLARYIVARGLCRDLVGQADDLAGRSDR